MFVPYDLDVLISKVVNIGDLRVQLKFWKREGFPCDLEPGLIQMVVVKMGIAQCVDKRSGFEVAYLRHHVGEQCIRCNIERDAEKDISASLVELTVQFPISDMELEKRMAWHQCHRFKFANVPCGNDDSSAVRVCFDQDCTGISLLMAPEG